MNDVFSVQFLFIHNIADTGKKTLKRKEDKRVAMKVLHDLSETELSELDR